jgi:ABC-type lipoprotein release transport system permease subunit
VSLVKSLHQFDFTYAPGLVEPEFERAVKAEEHVPAFAGGIVAGVAAAYWLTRLMTTLPYDVKPNDPLTFAVVILALVGAAFASCCLAAIRAARIDPVSALRAE